MNTTHQISAERYLSWHISIVMCVDDESFTLSSGRYNTSTQRLTEKENTDDCDKTTPSSSPLLSSPLSSLTQQFCVLSSSEEIHVIRIFESLPNVCVHLVITYRIWHLKTTAVGSKNREATTRVYGSIIRVYQGKCERFCFWCRYLIAYVHVCSST